MILNGHKIYRNQLVSFRLIKFLFRSADNLQEDDAAQSLLRYCWSFDDGHRDLLNIDQILRGSFGIRFRFFISPLLIDWGSSGSLEKARDKLRDYDATLLDWDELGRLVEKGHILGLHGYDHSDFSLMSDSQIIDQHEKSIELLKTRIGISTDSFAFPFGRVRQTFDLGNSLEIALTNKYFNRIYLSDNRLPPFKVGSIINRRHAEFDNNILYSMFKGTLQLRHFGLVK